MFQHCGNVLIKVNEINLAYGVDTFGQKASETLESSKWLNALLQSPAPEINSIRHLYNLLSA